MRKHSMIPTHVLTDEHFNEYKSHPVFKLADLPHTACFYLKFFLFDIFHKEEEILYFDADYCALRDFNPYQFGSGLCAVRDRTSVLEPHISYCGTILNYFNAGFIKADRDTHFEFFKKGREQGHRYKRKWNDQCIWNQLALDERIKINYLPRIFNFLDLGPAFLNSAPVAVHSSAHYPLFRARKPLETFSEHPWDLIAMRYQSGLNAVWERNKANPPYSVFLLPDGTDSDGKVWFISNNKHYMCDIKGYGLREVEFYKISNKE